MKKLTQMVFLLFVLCAFENVCAMNSYADTQRIMDAFENRCKEIKSDANSKLSIFHIINNHATIEQYCDNVAQQECDDFESEKLKFEAECKQSGEISKVTRIYIDQKSEQFEKKKLYQEHMNLIQWKGFSSAAIATMVWGAVGFFGIASCIKK